MNCNNDATLALEARFEHDVDVILYALDHLLFANLVDQVRAQGMVFGRLVYEMWFRSRQNC